MRRVRCAVGAALALLAATHDTRAQDSLPASPAPHRLPIDSARAHRFARRFEMLVHTPDSTVMIGGRDVSMDYAAYAGRLGWVLAETRTGLVPSTESLFVARDLSPLHWSSDTRGMRLSAEFTGDTVFGGLSLPTGKVNMVLPQPPDLLVSVPMAAALLQTLPLAPDWSDSVSVLAVDATGAVVRRAVLAVLGEEGAAGEPWSTPMRIVALRDSSNVVLFWVDERTGDVERVVATLPAHVGTSLEYRRPPPLVLPLFPPY